MPYNPVPAYPTPQHEGAARAIVDFFSRQAAVDSVLLVGSTARGKAGPDSCLDILVLCQPDQYAEHHKHLWQVWESEYGSNPAYAAMLKVGAFSHVDLDFSNGVFDPSQHHHGWTSGADPFELEVGNYVRYAQPLLEKGAYFQELRARWLPYYSEELRQHRLAMVLKYLRNNLAHIPLYAPRGLYFQCFKRFYQAFEEFLQALFIARRTYPIAYDKWVKEEVVDILGLPELYERLPHLLEIHCFESAEIVEKARQLEALVDEYVKE